MNLDNALIMSETEEELYDLKRQLAKESGTFATSSVSIHDEYHKWFSDRSAQYRIYPKPYPADLVNPNAMIRFAAQQLLKGLTK